MHYCYASALIRSESVSFAAVYKKIKLHADIFCHYDEFIVDDKNFVQAVETRVINDFLNGQRKNWGNISVLDEEKK